MATISIPGTLPSPSDDADQLHQCFGFAGWGTNERGIISILAHRSAADRRCIRDAFASKYGEDLLKSLDKDTSGDFERVLLLWTLDPSERDALLAYEAVRRWRPGNNVIIEIACARSSGELFAVRKAYHARYKSSLEEDMAAHTTGDFRKLLVPLVMSYRYEGEEVNMRLAKSEAKILNERITEKAYNDDEVIRILTTRSKTQLLATFNDYNNEFGHPINKDLKSDPKDEFLSALRAVIRCITSSEKYLEKVIRLAINKFGTDETALSRVITTRAEVDMMKIKELYYKRNSIPLNRAISKHTSGDYEAMLLALIGNEEA